MKIALIGTRGVPARYGGFETCVEEVGQRLAVNGHAVTVYCRPGNDDSPVPLTDYLGMQLVELPVVRKRSLETLAHTALSVLHRSLAGTEAAIVFNAANAPLLPVVKARRVPVATHVDGLEWRRGKWGPTGQRYYRLAESLAVRWSDALIADAQGIADYYTDEFGAATELIAYGAPILKNLGADRVRELGFEPGRYHLVIARFEPENHVLEIIQGYVASGATLPLVVVGSAPYADAYTAGLRAAADDRVHLVGGLWDADQVNELYANALTYLHGHSVGGTNPSLLRAAGAGTFTIAHDNVFNREVLAENAEYFSSPADVARLVVEAESSPDRTTARGRVLQTDIGRYNWDDVARRYEDLCTRLARRDYGPPTIGPSLAPCARHVYPMTMSERTLLVVNPSPDVYGADLQMLQTVSALVEVGWRVVVALPEDGLLVPRIRLTGAEVQFLSFPVLRKGNASPKALLTMLGTALASVPRCLRLVRRLEADVLLVNTVTLPWWVLVGRMARIPTVVHLHEAETEARRLVRRVLVAPVRLAAAVIVISRSAYEAMVDAQPALATRAHLVYNGVPQPPADPLPVQRGGRLRLAVVGRLSPRKAPDLAIKALAQLVSEGIDAELEVAGSPFPGYEWYEDQLHAQADRPELAGRVHFSGYCAPIWPVLERADIVLAPSLHEPFGNAVVEAQMSRRPVVAAASQGHLESIVDEETGLLVESGDAAAMAAATRRLLRDAELAGRIAETGRAEALRRFSVERYRSEVAALISGLV